MEAEANRKVLDATLALANLERIESTQQVEDLFRPVGLRDNYTLPADQAANYTVDQDRVRRWLAVILDRPASAARELHDEVDDVLARTVLLRPRLARHRKAGLALTYEVALFGVEAGYAYGVAFLLNHDAAAPRLARCSECGRFVATWKGKTQKWCSPKDKAERRRKQVNKANAKHRKKRRARAR